MRNKHNYCNLNYQIDLVLYHDFFKDLLLQRDAVKHILYFSILVYLLLLILPSQKLEEKYIPPHPSLPILHFSIWQALTFLCLFEYSKIDTAVLFDNNSHFYFLVHRKPYYMKTSLINSLTDSYRMAYMNQKISCLFVNCSLENSKEGAHHTGFVVS